MKETLGEMKGERIGLRALAESDVALVCSWRNDPDTGRFFYRKRIDPPEYSAWMKEVAANPDEELFGIVDAETGNLLGTLIYRIEKGTDEKEYATIGIMIGGKTERGRGYGREAMELITKALREKRGVSKFRVEVLSENKDAIEFYKRIGFEEESIVMKKET